MTMPHWPTFIWVIVIVLLILVIYHLMARR
jgi:hypothetical protein